MPILSRGTQRIEYLEEGEGETVVLAHSSVSGNRQLLEVERVVERGDRQLMQCSMPALLTVQKGTTVPRYPTLAGFLHAESSHVKALKPADLDFSKNDVLLSMNVTEIASHSNPRQ